VVEVLGKNENGRKSVTGVRLKNVKTNQLSLFPTDGVFVGIGHRPNTVLFRGQLEMDQVGYLITKDGSTSTNIPVCSLPETLQIASTVRQSLRPVRVYAAIDAERWLEDKPA